MEGLAAAGGVIAVLSLAGQVLEGCSYLRDIFDTAVTAPKEIRLMAMELSIIEALVRATPDVDQHREELDFCQERLSKLRELVEKYGDLDGASNHKKWGKRLAMAMGTKKIEKHLASLREAKGHLQHIQNLYYSSPIGNGISADSGCNRSAHNENLLKHHELLETIQQLSTSHSEATRIISRTEGKIQDIGGITKQTQLALHELANRFILRDNATMTQDDDIFRSLIGAFESMLSDQFSKHMSQLTLANRQTQHSGSNAQNPQQNHEAPVRHQEQPPIQTERL